MNKVTSVFYIGLHPHMLMWLRNDSVKVIGASHLEYLYRFSVNPFNLLFIFSYWLHKNRLLRVINFLLWQLVWLCKPFLTSVYRKYFEHVNEIIRQNIDVLDVDDTAGLGAYIKGKGIDLIVINSWSLLPAVIVSAPKYGSVNIHPSELPKYRGALPTLWSLKNGDTSSAVTYMLARDKADNGEIISQYAFSIERGDNWLSVEKKIDSIVQKTFIKDVLSYVDGLLIPKIQQGEVSGTGKYSEYMKINPVQEKVEDVLNKIGLYPYLEPSVYCYLVVANKEIHIKAASLQDAETVQSGTYKVSGNKIYVQVSDGSFSARLFIDISFSESLFLLFHRKGSLG